MGGFFNAEFYVGLKPYGDSSWNGKFDTKDKLINDIDKRLQVFPGIIFNHTQPAEDAVDDDKQEMLRRLARAYLQRFPSSLREGVRVRFDVVSVYLQPSGDEFDVYRGAFGW